MALQITRHDVEALRRRAQSAITQARKVAETSEQAIGAMIRSFEIGTTAFGFGVAKGFWGGVEVLGIPADLLAGGALHLVGFFAGEYGVHLHSFGDGAMAAYLHTLGAGIGRKLKDQQLAAGGAARQAA